MNVVAKSIACPKCGKGEVLRLNADYRRVLECIDCGGEDPLRSPRVAKLLSGELKPMRDPEGVIKHASRAQSPK